MAGPYKTPGVYVEEISRFPSSVAQVETAIPAFIGYTAKASKEGENLALQPTRIKSLVDYESIFGGAHKETFAVTVEKQTDAAGNELDPAAWRIAQGGLAEPTLIYRMYYSLRLYFANGGGPCYIVSVGDYGAGKIDAGELTQGLHTLEKADEPTIIVFPDAIGIENDGPAFYTLYASALAQCGKLMDRITLCDLYDQDVDAFRSGIGTGNLSYAAAYHPFLSTTLAYAYDEAAVTIAGFPGVEVLNNGARESDPDFAEKAAKSLYHVNNGLYHAVRDAIAKFSVVLPPSSLIAGVYARVDSTRGVWKAPANTSLTGVIRPTIQIDDDDQESLNVHETGKSINAIRTFTGKGILVWGARTLAGNDNEWRYVSVRRFFNMVEESVKKASEPFVFEPNDANTWVKVRAMIENFLSLQWRAGALAGAKPEQAYYVRVGLGETMTALDILEGRMIVEIGMAVVRPAEFIILQFSHKMQEA